MSKKLALSLAVLVPFAAFSTWVTVQHGVGGLLPVMLDDGWGSQIFGDLCISLVLVSAWLIPDAKKHGINPWPFVLGMLPLGSISALGYVVYRELAAQKRPERLAAAA